MISLKNTVSIATALLLVGSATHAQDFQWDGGGSNSKYETAENWATNVLPHPTGKNTMLVEIADGSTITFDESTGTQIIDLLNLNNGSTLNMTGGMFEHSRTGSNTRTAIGSSGGGTSVVNQSGGIMTIGHSLRLGEKNSSGVYNLTGGELIIFRGGKTLIGSPFGMSLSLGARDSIASMNISGGSLITRGGVEIESNATFNVQGAVASQIGIGVNKDTDAGTWFQRGTLKMGIDSKGVTKVYVAGGINGLPAVQFTADSKLDLSFHGTQPYNGTWTILEVEGADIIDEGLMLSEATMKDPSWSFKIDNSGPNGRLTATYNKYVSIPEPLSYSMALGVCCLLALSMRRVRA